MEPNEGAAAPVVDTTGGQGTEGAAIEGGEQTGQYGGFNTPEELAADYEAKTGELTRYQEQVRNLETLKGRHGNEIGTLRQQIAQLTGQIEGMRSATPPAPAGPTIDDIASKLESGDIDEATAIKMAHNLATQEAETRLGQKFQTMLQSELGKRDEQTAREKYVSQFLSENPGYKEAYENGKLDQWINQGMPGEVAWDKYQLQATKAELQTLKKQAEDAVKAAEAQGLNRGIQIEQGKSAAGKVLTGKGGQFAQVSGKFDLNDPNQRRTAGIERLKQLRGGSV